MMNPETFKEITGEEVTKNKSFKHDIGTFVDNSTDSIGGRNLEDIKNYTEKYMKLITKYYAANKLKLNGGKTTYMIMGNETKRNKTLNIKVGDDHLKNDLSIKILGWWVTPDNKMTHHLNKIRGPIYKILSEMKPYLKLMTLKERKELIYSKALGIAKYGLSLYAGQTEEIKDKLTTIFMRGNRAAYGSPLPFDTKNEWICRKISVKTPRQMIVEASAKVMHSVINTQNPPQIFNMVTFPRNFRKSAKVSLITAPRTQKCRRSLIYRSLKQFNALPNELKYCHPKTLKKLIEKRKIREIPDD